jgi:hypothetical protein
MNGPFARALATGAILAALAGSAHAGAVKTTTAVDLDTNDFSMVCNAVNAGSSTMIVVTRFYDLIGGLATATPGVALAPGGGTSHTAPSGKYVAYCQFVVTSGFPSDLRAGAVISNQAGHYMTTSEAR